MTIIQTIRSRPGRTALIALPLLLLLLFPMVYGKGFAIAFLSQVAIMALFALSYNMLLGQTGLLSFGHAVYAGLGGYCTIHLLNKTGADALGLGILLLPLAGGAGGAVAGFVFGYISTRRAGTTFAMITLGIAEMLVALALMLPGMSGGESGVSANRMLQTPVLGINLGSDTQVYYLAWAWTLASAALMYAFTQTPMGRLANAVRDNPERVAFIGFNPQKIRWAVMVIAGMFAGVSGALSAINYELVTIENLGIAQSGMVLVATYLGGVSYFLGPVAGAFVYVLFLSLISTLSKAWLLYFGMLFIAVVVCTPQGLLSLFQRGADGARPGLAKVVVAVLFCLAFVLAVEALYAYQDSVALGTPDGALRQLGQRALPLLLLLIACPLVAAWRRRRAMARPPAVTREPAHD